MKFHKYYSTCSTTFFKRFSKSRLENITIALHPCKKSNQWKIVRMGADIKIKCLGCNAIVMFSRRDF